MACCGVDHLLPDDAGADPGRAGPRSISRVSRAPQLAPRAKLTRLTVSSTTALNVATNNQPLPGGGTSNTAFLGRPTSGGGEQGNASANLVEATFWIETIAAHGDTAAFMQLQYSRP